MDNLFEKFHSLLYGDLVVNSPVLSGNMQSLISYGQIGEDYTEIIIDAPFYDGKKFKKDNVIVHTNQILNGFTGYAQWVNDNGAFNTHNKSEHWVNRVVNDVAHVIANEVGGEVINELGL